MDKCESKITLSHYLYVKLKLYSKGTLEKTSNQFKVMTYLHSHQKGNDGATNLPGNGARFEAICILQKSIGRMSN